LMLAAVLFISPLKPRVEAFFVRASISLLTTHPLYESQRPSSVRTDPGR
jgi:hypothetical protein